jgi:hypothetical protein
LVRLQAPISNNAFDCAKNICPVVLTKWYIGFVPTTSEPGDETVIVGGTSVPFVREEGEFHRLIGACYIHGAMNGGL